MIRKALEYNDIVGGEEALAPPLTVCKTPGEMAEELTDQCGIVGDVVATAPSSMNRTTLEDATTTRALIERSCMVRDVVASALSLIAHEARDSVAIAVDLTEQCDIVGDVVAAAPSLTNRVALEEEANAELQAEHNDKVRDVVALAPSLTIQEEVVAAAMTAQSESDAVSNAYPTVPSASVLNAREAFVSKLKKRAASLMSAPAVAKRRPKGSIGITPRRSRRLAGAGAEFKPEQLIAKRSTKKEVMCTLEVISEHEGIDQQAQDDYAKLFSQPLSDSHIQALAALFKWSIPEELGQNFDEVPLP